MKKESGRYKKKTRIAQEKGGRRDVPSSPLFAKHYLGQNFLRSEFLAAELAALSGAAENSLFLEIGAGEGALTQALLEAGAILVAAEIDTDLFLPLARRFREALRSGRLHLYFGDAENLDFRFFRHFSRGEGPLPALFLSEKTPGNEELRRSLTAFWKEDPHEAEFGGGRGWSWGDFVSPPSVRSLRMAANLPYYLTREFLYKALSELPELDSLSFMLQSEAAARLLAAEPADENFDHKLYGPAALLRSYYGRGRILKRLRRGDFSPPPRVDSVYVRLDRDNDSLLAEYAVLAEALGLKMPTAKELLPFFLAAFSARRKTLRRSLCGKRLFEERGELRAEETETALFSLGLRENVRAEELDLRRFMALYLLLQTTEPACYTQQFKRFTESGAAR